MKIWIRPTYHLNGPVVIKIPITSNSMLIHLNMYSVRVIRANSFWVVVQSARLHWQLRLSVVDKMSCSIVERRKVVFMWLIMLAGTFRRTIHGASFKVVIPLIVWAVTQVRWVTVACSEYMCHYCCFRSEHNVKSKFEFPTLLAYWLEWRWIPLRCSCRSRFWSELYANHLPRRLMIGQFDGKLKNYEQLHHIPFFRGFMNK
jgi:hypothetical protein